MGQRGVVGRGKQVAVGLVLAVLCETASGTPCGVRETFVWDLVRWCRYAQPPAIQRSPLCGSVGWIAVVSLRELAHRIGGLGHIWPPSKTPLTPGPSPRVRGEGSTCCWLFAYLGLRSSTTPAARCPSLRPRLQGYGPSGLRTGRESNFGFVVGGPGAEAVRVDDSEVVCWAAWRVGEWFGGSL